MKTTVTPARIAWGHLGRCRACLLASILVSVIHGVRADESSGDPECSRASKVAAAVQQKGAGHLNQEQAASQPCPAAHSAANRATKTGKLVARPGLAAVQVDNPPANRIVVTGSRIPHAVKRGGVLVTPSPVVTMDRDRIRRSGAQTPADLFGRFPPNR